MATIDRFKTALRIGISFKDGENLIPLTAQMKYDYLAAVHTMDQLTNLHNELEERKKRRDALRVRGAGRWGRAPFFRQYGAALFRTDGIITRGRTGTHADLFGA